MAGQEGTFSNGSVKMYLVSGKGTTRYSPGGKPTLAKLLRLRASDWNRDALFNTCSGCEAAKLVSGLLSEHCSNCWIWARLQAKVELKFRLPRDLSKIC